MLFKTSHVVGSESKNKIFVSRIVFLLFTLKFREVILPHSVYTLSLWHTLWYAMYIIMYFYSIWWQIRYPIVLLNHIQVLRMHNKWLIDDCSWLILHRIFELNLDWPYSNCSTVLQVAQENPKDLVNIQSHLYIHSYLPLRLLFFICSEDVCVTMYNRIFHWKRVHVQWIKCEHTPVSYCNSTVLQTSTKQNIAKNKILQYVL